MEPKRTVIKSFKIIGWSGCHDGGGDYRCDLPVVIDLPVLVSTSIGIGYHCDWLTGLGNLPRTSPYIPASRPQWQGYNSKKPTNHRSSGRTSGS